MFDPLPNEIAKDSHAGRCGDDGSDCFVRSFIVRMRRREHNGNFHSRNPNGCARFFILDFFQGARSAE